MPRITNQLEQNIIDKALMEPFKNDLCDMTREQVDEAIREAENQLAEIEPWLEALTAKRRSFE